MISNPGEDNTAFLAPEIAYALLGEVPSTSSPGECEEEGCGRPATIHVLGDMDCHVSLYCCDAHVPEWVNHGEFALRRVQSRQFLESCNGSLAESEYGPFGPDDQIPERPVKFMTADQMREVEERDEQSRRGEIVAE